MVSNTIANRLLLKSGKFSMRSRQEILYRDPKIYDANVDDAAFKTIELLPKRKKMND